MGLSLGAWARGALGASFVVSALLSGFPNIPPAHAEVRKVIFVCLHGRKKEICPQFRAGIEAPTGWGEDKIAEAKQGRVIFVPRGKTYENAPAAITVQATPNRAKTSADTLAERDNATFRQDYKNAVVAPLAPIASAGIGGAVKLFRQTADTLKPRGFQIVGFFADKDADGAPFVVQVVASAQTERGLAELRPKLEQMIKTY